MRISLYVRIWVGGGDSWQSAFIKWDQQGQKLSDEGKQAFPSLTSTSKTRVLNKMIP